MEWSPVWVLLPYINPSWSQILLLLDEAIISEVRHSSIWFCGPYLS